MNGKRREAAVRHQSKRSPEMRGRMVAMATVAALLMACAPAAANGGGSGYMGRPQPTTYQVAVNRGFEDPDIPTGSWANLASIPGWYQTINSCGIEVQDHVAGTPYEGGQFVELNSGCRSGIKQTIELPFNTRTTVSFAFSPRPGTEAEDNVLQAYWNGTLVKTVGPQAGASDTLWSRHSVTVTSNSAESSNTLKFVSAGKNPSGGGVGVYLDGVRVEYQGPAEGPSGPVG